MSSSSSAPTPRDHADPSATPSAADSEGQSPHPLVLRLVEYRKAKGWTQEQAAAHLQIPLNTLRGYECGNRNPGGANTEKILALVGLPRRKTR